MPTTNPPLTKTWVKIAENTDANVLVQAYEDTAVEYALTATDSAPSVSLNGHRLVGAELAAVRSILGEGYVWARISPRAVLTEATLILTK